MIRSSSRVGSPRRAGAPAASGGWARGWAHAPLGAAGGATPPRGAPRAEVEVDIWHADADGLYSQVHPGLPQWNLRGRVLTDDDGAFEVHTVKAPPYEIPKDGPTGTVLYALGRHFYRPAHIHLKLRRADLGELTSQLYFADGDYLDSDVANAVRDELMLPVTRDGDRYRARHDFVLSV